LPAVLEIEEDVLSHVFMSRGSPAWGGAITLWTARCASLKSYQRQKKWA